MIRFIAKFISWTATILLVIILSLKISGNGHLFKALRSTYMVGLKEPTINDYKIFDNREIKAGHQVGLKQALSKRYYEIDNKILDDIASYDPIGFIVLLDGEIILEKYYQGYNDASMTNSFSVAKSLVSLAMLQAIDQGYVESVEQKVIDFIPELDGKYREDVRIRHLLEMTSGIDYNESYGNPFGFMAAAYYGDDLEDLALNYDADTEPGSEWEYLGGNTILMSIIVHRATGKNMGEYFQEEIWKKIGSPFPALWSLDHAGGIEKAYCCFYTSLRDFARFGLLLNGNGEIFNQRVMNEDLLAELKKPVVLNNGDTIPHYGWHWWKIKYEGADVTYARGIYGQYIITIPEWGIVVARLGTRRGAVDEFKHPVDLYDYLKFAKTIYDQSCLHPSNVMEYIPEE